MMQRRTCVYDRSEDWEVAVRHSVDYGRLFENLMQNIGTVQNGFPQAVPYDVVANRANYDPQAIRNNLMFGTPDEVIEKLQVYEEQGVDLFTLGLSFNLPFELQMRTLRLFINEVMPHFAMREHNVLPNSVNPPRSNRAAYAGDTRTTSVAAART
jgi:alkanesulfonate monooxygenase SsuD/methylene tetrahydromethanopterin reductase-like flavin-dependent oxidoreductase (luciferase family)